MPELGSWIWQMYNHETEAFTQSIDALNQNLSEVVWLEQGTGCLGKQARQRQENCQSTARNRCATGNKKGRSNYSGHPFFLR
jgi:hypothetical protein